VRGAFVLHELAGVLDGEVYARLELGLARVAEVLRTLDGVRQARTANRKA
jgi:hypothetical protein